MALVLMGKRYYDFTNDKDQNFKGVKLHCIQEFSTQNEGTLTDVISVNSRSPIYHIADQLEFGTVFTPVYNRYGRMEDIVVKALPEAGK